MATQSRKAQTTAVEEWHPSPEVQAELETLLATLPTQDGDGMESLVRQILAAEDWEGVNLSGKLAALKDVASRDVRIETIKANQSRFSGGVGAYLVVTGVDTGSGAEFTAATSSVVVMLQLLKLHALGALPVLAHVEESAVPTAGGNYPQRLVVTASAGTAFAGN